MTTQQGMLEFEQIEGLIEQAKFDAVKYHGVDAGIGADVALSRFRERFRQAATPQGREALRRAVAEINVDDDGHSEGNLQYALIRGFSAMGWAQPTVASNDAIDAIVALALTPAVAPDGALEKQAVPPLLSNAPEFYEALNRAREQVFVSLRRLGYEPAIEQWANSTEELKKRSAQYRLRDKTEVPKSFEEVTAAVLEALIIQGGFVVHDGDGVSCVAQMIWAQHERAQAALTQAQQPGEDKR